MKQFREKMQQQLNKMVATGKLFRSKVTGDSLWAVYLESFKQGNDPKFRDPASSVHNCNHCKNFVRRYGNIVAFDEDLNMITLFDFVGEGEFENVPEELSKVLNDNEIQDVFFETYDSLNALPYESCSKKNTEFKLGIVSNTKRYTKEEAEMYGVVKPNELRKFEHMSLTLPKQFVPITKESVQALTGKYRDAFHVFNRGMEEIPLDTLNLVKDLIKQGSLLDGTAHLGVIEAIIPLKKQYDDVPSSKRVNWCWVNSYNNSLAKFKNSLIGVLCSELAEGMELNKACTNWNKRVDPVNYKKAKAPITERQIKEAKLFVEENGYESSFNRRFATIDDIKASEILHINSGEGTIQKISVFDSVKSTSTRHKRSEFDGVEEVSIEKFIKDILPGCTSVEAFLKNNHQRNMVTITTAADDDSKNIFKWNNNYSWTFEGNLTGKSQLAEKVEALGGRIDGVFRFTHSWNEIEPNQSLMDLHVFMPGCQLPDDLFSSGGPNVVGRRVGWNKRSDAQSGGTQDVDYTSKAPTGYIPVENITFPDIDRMPDGKYTCMIHNWSHRQSAGKGRAEIAFGDEVYNYIYPNTSKQRWFKIAEVTKKGTQFTIEHFIDEENSSKEIWGLDSNKFHEVNLVCPSPNHWSDNEIGNKHYFFMLKNAKIPTSMRSFHNENLKGDLVKHRKVMEVLANTTMIEPEEKALAGLGFNSTVRDEVILRLKGTHKRVIKVKF